MKKTHTAKGSIEVICQPRKTKIKKDPVQHIVIRDENNDPLSITVYELELMQNLKVNDFVEVSYFKSIQPSGDESFGNNMICKDLKRVS